MGYSRVIEPTMSDDEPRTKSYHGPYDRKRRNVLKTLAAGGLAGALGGTVLTGSTVAQPDKGAENSGKFVLEGTADIVSEPDVRPTNHVLEIDTSADGLFGSASRKLGVKAGDLDGSLSFDYFIVSGDCGGGPPDSSSRSTTTVMANMISIL